MIFPPPPSGNITQDKNVCIIGLGYVGLTLGVALADVGFRVTGIEVAPEILKCLNEGRAHFTETGLDRRLRKNIDAGRFFFSDDIAQAAGASAYIITVGTPVDDAKKTRINVLEAAARDVAKVLLPHNLVILRSTVRVGICRELVKPILDETGAPYHLAFCPERTIEGKAIEELRSLPQVIGGLDDASTIRAAQLFYALTPSVVRVSSLEAAEMVKLVNNTHRDIMFAYANEIATAAEASGLSAMEVIKAANFGYPRGGVRKPGPVGGPCLEKDPYILAEGLARAGVTPDLLLAGRRLNETLPQRVAARVAALMRARDGTAKKVALLGLAFKGRPATSDLRGTLAKPLGEALQAAFPGARLVGWDPVVAPDMAREELKIEVAATLEDAALDADLIVIQNNHPAFAEMNLATLSATMNENGLIFDLWAQNEGDELVLRNNVAYGCLGSAHVQGGALQKEQTQQPSGSEIRRAATG